MGIALAAALLAGFALWPGNLQRLLHRSDKKALAPSTVTADQFQKAQDFLLRSYKESNLAEAVKGFQAIPDSDPNYPLAQARLGTAYFIQYNYRRDPKLLDMAKAATARAIALNADLAAEDWRWPVSLGVNEFAQGKIPDAISDLQHGIELDGDNAVAYYDLSIAHMQSNHLDDARKDLEKSIQLDPTDRKFTALASVLLFDGKYDQSVSMQRKAIELNPNSYEAWDWLGAAYQWSGKNKDKAAQAFGKAVELEEAERAKRGRDPVLLVILANDYAAIGNSAKSLVFVRQALALAADNPQVEYTSGQIYETLSMRDRAIPLLAKALANGYGTLEFQRNPELAKLRTDPAFTSALALEMKKPLDAAPKIR